MAFLECKDLSFGYGAQVVQEHVNCAVEKGDYFYIVGENGSGKSTLLKTMLGFLKPIAGSVEYAADWDRSGIGYLPQQSELQKSFPATVKEIVRSGCQSQLGWRPFYSKASEKLAEQNLERLGMSDYAHKSFRHLSGGQQQRVLLARALCAARSVLFLDEPAKGFDAEITDTMYRLLQELHQDGMTIITVSHDKEAAETYGTRILQLEKNGGMVR